MHINTEGDLSAKCVCSASHQDCAFIAVTGGPGSGKTSILETLGNTLCEHMTMLPEAASILFAGGFRRLPSYSARKAVQRAIFHVQHESERLIRDEKRFALALCDRGTLDGLAYWPGKEEEFWEEIGSSRKEMLGVYRLVIHLRTPTIHNGYNHQNPVRTESVDEAKRLDDKLLEVWDGHPQRIIVKSYPNFLDKVKEALDLVRTQFPKCCSK